MMSAANGSNYPLECGIKCESGEVTEIAQRDWLPYALDVGFETKKGHNQKLFIFLWKGLFIRLFIGGFYLFLSEWLEGWCSKWQESYVGMIMQVQVCNEETRMTRDLVLYVFRERCLSDSMWRCYGGTCKNKKWGLGWRCKSGVTTD